MITDMQNKITFFENTFEVEAFDKLKIFRPTKRIQKIQRFIEVSDWDKRMLKFEKYINRFSIVIIAAAAIFFLPVCIAIMAR